MLARPRRCHRKRTAVHVTIGKDMLNEKINTMTIQFIRINNGNMFLIAISSVCNDVIKLK